MSSDKLLGRFAAKLGLITEAQLYECLQIQEQRKILGESIPNILDLLIEHEYLTEPQKEKLIEDWQKKNQQVDQQIQQMKEDESKQHIICQSCGAHFRLDMHKIPKNFKCGQCGTPLKLPQTSLRARVGQTLSFLGVRPSRKKIMVPGYQLKDKISEDATGTVYRAISEETNDTVVIKLFNEETRTDAAFMVVLQNTVQKSLSLDIPNLARNLQFGIHEKSVFVVSEYIEGKTITELLKRHSEIPFKKAVKLILRAASTLNKAHKRGMFHGDISPDNIILSPNGKVVITQFGIPNKVVRNVLSVVEKVGIAPLYLAPEHVSGQEAPDYLSDIYSLGVVLYHMLAGRPPLEGNTPFALMTIMSEKLPLPSLHLYNTNVPDEICELVEKMMALDRKERYQSYEALIEDLQDPFHGTAKEEALIVQEPESASSRTVRGKERVEDEEDIPEAQLVEEATEAPDRHAASVFETKAKLSDSTATQVSPPTDIGSQKISTESEVQSTPRKETRDRAERPILRGRNYQQTHWVRWTIVLSILVLIGWGIWSLIQLQIMYKRAGDEYYTLSQLYNDNRDDHSRRTYLLRLLNDYISKYADQDLPLYKEGRTYVDEARNMAAKVVELQTAYWENQASELRRCILEKADQKKFYASLDLFEQPTEIPAEITDVALANLKPQVIEQAKQHAISKREEWQEILQRGEISNVAQQMDEFLANYTQDNKTKPELEECVVDIQQHIQKNRGIIAAYLAKAEEEKRKNSKLLLKNYLAEVRQISNQGNYPHAVEHLHNLLVLTKELLEEDRKALLLRKYQMEQVANAKNLLVKHLNTIPRNTRIKIAYRKQYREVRRVDYQVIVLDGDFQVRWADFPKDQLAVFIQYILANKTSTTTADRLAYAMMCYEIRNYTLAYQIFKTIPKEKEAVEFLTYFEQDRESETAIHWEEIQQDLANNKQQEAMQNALWVRENCFLPGQWDNPYHSQYQELFLTSFRKIFGDGKELFLDFSQSNQVSKYENTQSKFAVQAGQLEFIRGSLTIPITNPRFVGGLLRMPNIDDEVQIFFLQDNRQIYSIKLRGDGNVYYNVFASGVIKNDEFPLLQDWCMFGLGLTQTHIVWYVNYQNRYTLPIPTHIRCDAIQIQAKSLRDRIFFDNLFLGSK